MVAESSLQEEVRQKFQPNSRSQAYQSIADYARGLHDIGLGLYEWQLPLNKFVMSNMSFRENWQRFFIGKEPEARNMRTHGITMTKLIPQPLGAPSPVPETRIFGQL